MLVRTTLALAALVLAGPATAGDAAPPDVSDVRRFAETFGLTGVETGVASTVDGKLVVRDVRGVMPGPAGAPVRTASFGAVSMEGLAASDGARTFSLIDIGGIALGDYAVERMVVSGLALPTTGKAVRWSAYQAQGIRDTAGKAGFSVVSGLRVTAEDWSGGHPGRVAFQIRGMALRKPPERRPGPSLIPAQVDLDASLRMEPTAGRLHLEDLTLYLGESASITATAVLSGADPSESALVSSLVDALPGVRSLTPIAVTKPSTPGSEVRIESASLTLRNKGLVQAILAEQARSYGVTPQYAALATEGSIRSAVAKHAGPVLTNEAMTAIRAFLADPRTLTLSLAPLPGKGQLMPTLLSAAMGTLAAADLGAKVRANGPEAPLNQPAR